MINFTDEMMREMLVKTRKYSLIILKRTEKYAQIDAGKIVWEHGRRNFQLRAAGLLSIVCPINDGSDVCGMGIFTTDLEGTKKIMDDDPGVQAGIFTYEVHPCSSFPGDSLP